MEGFMRFWFDENMFGTYKECATGAQGRYDFTCRALAQVLDLVKTKTAQISGVVKMGDRQAPLSGTLFMDLFFAKRLTYDFEFSLDGQKYRFVGDKRIKFLDFLRTMTTLIGRIDRDGERFADVESHFRLRELLKFLSSFRVSL
jgi:hypothetical protein